jgi:predicted P-loop ATPase
MSRQRDKGENKEKKVVAAKSQAAALGLKALYLDIDVKPKAFPVVGDAVSALAAFCPKYKLPGPTALVGSGGGLHAYWISDRELTPDEWQPYANGLKSAAMEFFGTKIDAGVIADSARVLRIPGTWNYKQKLPRAVKLLSLKDTDYDFAQSLSVLAGYTPIQTFKSQAPLLTGKPSVLFASTPMESLSEGIGRDPLPPLDWSPLISDCGWFRDALKTGGKDFSQGLWNLSTLAATFLEDGHALAHKMARGHPGYNYGETETLWERKITERQSLSLGWPSCKSIQGEGCTHCATCPILARNKSPLHLARVPNSAMAPVVPPNVVPGQMGTTVVTNPVFRDVTSQGATKPSLANAIIAITSLGIKARYDKFRHHTNIEYKGTSTTISEGLLTDNTVGAVRVLINDMYKIDCGDANTLSAIKAVAMGNAYDPVLNILDEFQGRWDGIKRLDTWVINYLSCEDTPLNRAFGYLVLIAACRRARVPGCKFDNITVLEGVEGTNKSTAIRVLAGDDYFSDQSILSATDKEVQEQLDGIWMHENADLAGMRRADIEAVKAFASRQVDRARPAYGRVREDRPRRSIEWGTTNSDIYLISQTGNRRFWPLKTGVIDIQALRRDREQLLGEAATYEAAGESITLDPSLWGDAREAQDERRVPDPWEATLSNGGLNHVISSSGGYDYVASAHVLMSVLQVPIANQTALHTMRLATALKNIGWDRPKSGKVWISGKQVRGFMRPTP